jgi:hypothetical protein
VLVFIMSAPKIVLWNSFFVISGVVNRHFLNNYLSYKSFQTAKKVPKDNFWSPYENQQNGSTLDFLRNGSNVVPQILKNKKLHNNPFMPKVCHKTPHILSKQYHPWRVL